MHTCSSCCIATENIIFLEFGVSVVICFACVKLVYWVMNLNKNILLQLKQSPVIKPINYPDEDIMLRRSLIAMNWKLISNQARALYYIRMAHRVPKRATSFTSNDCVFSRSMPSLHDKNTSQSTQVTRCGSL